MKELLIRILILSAVLFASMALMVCAYAYVNMTEDEAVDWVLGLVDDDWGSASNTPNYDGSSWTPGDYGEPQCVDLIAYYLDELIGKHYGLSAYQYCNLDLYEGLSYTDTPHRGDIVVWNAKVYPDYGHIGIIYEVDGSEFKFVDTRGDNSYYISGGLRYNTGARKRGPKSSATTFIHPDFKPDEERGTYMTTGYDRVLPDGDYIIAAHDNTKYYLDIQGYSLPAGDHDDVQLFYAENMDDIGACDVWTISYSGGFYTVRQKGTSMCLDVKGDGEVKGTDVQVFNSNNPSSSAATSSWAISRSGDDRADHLQARSSGYYLDMEHGIGNRMNIRQWHFSTDTNDQKWVFIPYKPQQPVEAGRYMLVTALDESYIMDVVGDTGEVGNDTNVRLWSDTADNRYNCFDLIPLDNGYYKILHAASGKALDVHGASLDNRGNISLYDDNGRPSQQWAIVRNGSGYTIWARCSGKVIDMAGYEAKNGVNIFQYYYIGTPIQTWKFVPAEHTVSFDANGGDNAPEPQTKYYKNALTIVNAAPTRPGYDFLGWAIEPGGAVAYQPGDAYDADADITLYAVWKRTYETLLVLPAALTEIEPEAFAGVAADAVVVPAGVMEIGEGAFSDVIILGWPGTAAEDYADANGLTFIPIGNDWVAEDEVPVGATIIDEKWTYTQTVVETTTSTAASMDGWEQDGFTWQKTGEGTRTYASYPAGFDAGHALYAKYAKGALSSSTTGNTKREVGGSSLVSYIYWQWAWNDQLGNYYIESAPGEKDGRNYQNFYAFETTTAYGQTQPNGYTDDECYYTEDYPGGSWWWFRFEVRRQTYTDYEKLFNYRKVTTTREESDAPVAEGEGVSDVRHWVKYSF